jgi:hypothetical protein
VPLTEIWRITIERREFGTLGLRDVLVVTHEAGKDRAEALFAGEGIGAWSEAIRRAALAGDGDGDGDGDAGS